jgi:hypothetical protein
MAPPPPLPPVICNIEYERLLINAGAVDVPADAGVANERTIVGDVASPVITVRV